ncbi:hypothetical protein [Streptomyces sp. NPDC046805]|uniref:hypothetical protein n=1 Tax=Streptomyces sp. NPDC046805 TaxID=3155134 RepID=UPI00340D675D
MLLIRVGQTIRDYLNGEKTPGQRRQASDAFSFLDHCRQRLTDDFSVMFSVLK